VALNPMVAATHHWSSWRGCAQCGCGYTESYCSHRFESFDDLFRRQFYHHLVKRGRDVLHGERQLGVVGSRHDQWCPTHLAEWLIYLPRYVHPHLQRGGWICFVIGRTHRPSVGNTDRRIHRNAKYNQLGWKLDAQVVCRERNRL